jgi:hypothetical protein
MDLEYKDKINHNLSKYKEAQKGIINENFVTQYEKQIKLNSLCFDWGK